MMQYVGCSDVRGVPQSYGEAEAVPCLGEQECQGMVDTPASCNDGYAARWNRRDTGYETRDQLPSWIDEAARIRPEEPDSLLVGTRDEITLQIKSMSADLSEAAAADHGGSCAGGRNLVNEGRASLCWHAHDHEIDRTLFGCILQRGMETATPAIYQGNASLTLVEGFERLRHGRPDLPSRVRRTYDGDPAGRKQRR
jgi:hypothetical protein